jgi:hypothetical protein
MPDKKPKTSKPKTSPYGKDKFVWKKDDVEYTPPPKKK